MAKEDKRLMAARLEERISDVQKLTKTQLDMMNQLMLTKTQLMLKCFLKW